MLTWTSVNNFYVGKYFKFSCINNNRQVYICFLKGLKNPVTKYLTCISSLITHVEHLVMWLSAIFFCSVCLCQCLSTSFYNVVSCPILCLRDSLHVLESSPWSASSLSFQNVRKYCNHKAGRSLRWKATGGGRIVPVCNSRGHNAVFSHTGGSHTQHL